MVQIKSKKSILLSGYYGYRNVGDDLLLETLVSFLTQKYPLTVISATVNDSNAIPESIKSKINCISEPIYSKKKIVRLYEIIRHEINMLKNHDILIYGGGTRLFETSTRTYQTFLIKFIVLQFNQIFLKRKIIHLGVGIGSVNSEFSKWLLKRILTLSDQILLRDKTSYNKAVASIGNKNKIYEGFDLMFLKDKPEIDIPMTKTKIGFSLFQYYSYIDKDKEKAILFKNEIENLLCHLLADKRIEIYLFSFQQDNGGNDELFNQELCKKINSERLVHISYSKYTNQITNSISQLDLCMGMRYHFCLLGLFYNKPTIGINYQPKVQYEYNALNLENYCIQITEMSKILNLVDVWKTTDNFNSEFLQAFEKIESRKLRLESMVYKILAKYI